LRDLIAAHAGGIMGPHWQPARPFPILVKWLDCQERLSLQVHPPAGVADELRVEPKTENWFVADASPAAGLVVGLRRGVSREDFERGLRNGALDSLVHRFPVRAGDSILVRSGRLHAIDGGNLILEIQQNSDTTYRVYDWGRVGLDGRPRTLHVAESMRCIDFEDFEPEPLRAAGGDRVLAECAEFRIRQFERGAGAAVLRDSQPAGQARLLHVVQGGVAVETTDGRSEYRAGDCILLPAMEPFSVEATVTTLLLLTDGFSGR
jgi:mannose-6-phosphate isomerase